MVKRDDSAAGMAALAMCESMILAIVETRLLDAEAIKSALEDAADVHRAMARDPESGSSHKEAAKLIDEAVQTLLATEEF